MQTHLGDHECNSTHQRSNHDTDSPETAIALARVLGFTSGLAEAVRPSAAPGIRCRRRRRGYGLVGVTCPCIRGSCGRLGIGFVGVTSPLNTTLITFGAVGTAGAGTGTGTAGAGTAGAGTARAGTARAGTGAAGAGTAGFGASTTLVVRMRVV